MHGDAALISWYHYPPSRQPEFSADVGGLDHNPYYQRFRRLVSGVASVPGPAARCQVGFEMLGSWIWWVLGLAPHVVIMSRWYREIRPSSLAAGRFYPRGRRNYPTESRALENCNWRYLNVPSPVQGLSLPYPE